MFAIANREELQSPSDPHFVQNTGTSKRGMQCYLQLLCSIYFFSFRMGSEKSASFNGWIKRSYPCHPFRSVGATDFGGRVPVISVLTMPCRLAGEEPVFGSDRAI